MISPDVQKMKVGGVMELSNPKLWERVDAAPRKIAKWPKWKLGLPRNERPETIGQPPTRKQVE